MTNYNLKSLDNLKHIKPTWKNGKTTSIRIPIVLKNSVLSYGRYIDENNIKDDKILKLYQYLISVKDKLGNENGYINKNSGKLIRDIAQFLTL